MTKDSQKRYCVTIQAASNGASFPGGPLSPATLQEAHDQVAFRALRQGLGGANLSETATEEEPLLAAGSEDRLTGVRIHAGNNGQRIHKDFGIDLFAPQASAQAASLIKNGFLQEGDKFLYQVTVLPAAPSVPSPLSVRATVEEAPLPLGKGRLDDWLPRSQAVGPVQPDDYPLFFPASILERTRSLCQKPGAKEAGALVLAKMFRQRAPNPEIFAVANAAIEVKYADHEQFSLNLTPQSFAYLQAQLQRRRTRLGFVDELPLAMAHSHPFTPAALTDGKSQCGNCPKRTSCQLSSAFYSARDTEFHRALFGRQPWAVGLVFGKTPREEDDLRLFCLDGVSPRQRGFYLLSEG